MAATEPAEVEYKGPSHIISAAKHKGANWQSIFIV